MNLDELRSAGYCMGSGVRPRMFWPEDGDAETYGMCAHCTRRVVVRDGTVILHRAEEDS